METEQNEAKPNQGLKLAGGAVLFLGIVGLWTWYDLKNKPANERINAGIKKMVAQEPRLKPAYDEAMRDGKLTLSEADRITKQAEEFKKR